MLTKENVFTKYLEAIKIACTHHSLQKYGNNYYFAHLEAVERILFEEGYAVTTIGILEKKLDAYRYVIDAWLHDILEDGCLSYNDLKKRFGKDIADDCYDMQEHKGKNRKERKPPEYYINIGKNIYAGRVKIADRIANIECSTEKDLLEMYKKEQKEFSLIYDQNPEAFQRLWDRLEKSLTI